MKQKITLFLKGALIGIANSIPGVSGGTIAYILNVYELLITALSLNIKYILNNFTKLLMIGLGLLSGLFLFATLLDDILYSRFPLIVNLAFIGLIIGSLNFVFIKTNLKLNKIDIKSYLVFGLGVLIVALPALLLNIDNQVITELSLINTIGLYLAGNLAAFAMIIPGLSGSFVFLVFGYYQSVIKAVADLNFMILIPVALGIISGLIFGARIIRYSLSNYPLLVYKLILGFLVGSVFVIDTTGFGFNLDTLIGSIILITLSVITNQLTQIKST